MTAHTISGALDAHHPRSALAVLVALALWASAVGAQEASFTYQGQLTDGGTPANGDYDFQFALFDNDGGGTQVGETQTLPAVAVSNGLFTVDLNFGISPFTGDNRFLDIAVRPVSGGSFTTLTPRQFISSTPYSIRTLSAASADGLSGTCTGCVQDTQIQSVAGSKVTGTIPVASVPAGSTHYTQNTTNQQPNANFNIAGNGTVGGTLSGQVVNSTTQYNIGDMHALSVDDLDNTFVGRSAGAANQGNQNSFFGAHAGATNTSGSDNAFFGDTAGLASTTGFADAFFGSNSGGANTMGTYNAFFGTTSGGKTTTGTHNAFFGSYAGVENTTGSNNTAIGDAAGVSSGNLTNATAVGWDARVAQSNSLVLGSIKGTNGATESTNVGIGTTTPAFRLHVVDSGNAAMRVQTNTTGGTVASFGGFGDFQIDANNVAGGRLIVKQDGKVGIGTNSPLHLVQVGGGFDGHLGFDASDGSPNAGYIRFGDNTGWKLHLGRARQSSGGALNTGPTGAIMTLQDNGNVGIGTTAPQFTLSVNGTAAKSGGGSWSSISDERLKTIKGRFTPGVDAVMQLQPIRYEYTQDNALGIRATGEHIGFGAHAVRQVIPEAVTENDQGYLLVNNDPILWTMLNAIKEQQHAIKEQQQEIEQLREDLQQLRAAGAGGS